MLACSAVLSGEELIKIHTRGYKRFIGFAISTILLMLHLNVSVLVIIWIVAFIGTWIVLLNDWDGQ